MSAKRMPTFATKINAISFLVCLQSLAGFAQTGPDYQTVQSFLNAIASDDTNTASQLLDSNTNLASYPYNMGKLPSLEAAKAGNLPLVKHLLELGANVNAVGDTLSSGGAQMTALDEAAQSGQLEVCRLLLEAGANPNHRAFSMTTLHFVFDNFRAVTNRNDIAKLLLDYGANPFIEAGYYRTTPFELEITKSDGRLVPLMLDDNRRIKVASKPAIRTSTERTAIPVREQITPFLAAHGAAMLSAAVQRGELEAVQALLQAGVTGNTAGSTNLSLMQSFALASAEAAKSRPSAVEQWHQAQERLKADYIPNADPRFVASLRSEESRLAAKVESLNAERWRKIFNLLIQHGANYDAFAATALNDTNQLVRLVAIDKSVAQSRDCDGQTPLHWAVRAGQLPLVSFWVKAGGELAATNCAGQTALHLAAAGGKTEIVTALLSAKAPTNIRDTNGWTALDAAIQAKQSDSIHLLLGDKTAAPHPERGLSITLHEAAANGNVAALAALTETATNLEARNELGLTPLQVAVTRGHLAAAALLVDKGADVNVRDPDGNSLLHQIFLQERYEVYDRPPANWLARLGQDPRRETYVKYLTVGQNEQGPNPVLQGTSFLLACSLDPGATNHAGQTVMQLITEEKIGRGIFFFDNDREELFKLLGSAGGTLDQRDASGNTALHRAATKDYNWGEEVSQLIASGADVNATNLQGRTPLHFAVASAIWPSDAKDTNGLKNNLLALIEAKANVNAQDNDGLTPLHVLAMTDTSDRDRATKALLDAGANYNLRDKHGRTPAHLFLSGNWPWNEASKCITLLAKAGADLSAKDDQGKTPLHYLATLGDRDPMFFLRGIGDTFVAAKVDLEARDNDGDTPLLIAARTGTHDVYNWLIQHGADLDATNNAGETPRRLALHSTNPFMRFPPSSETDIQQAIREGKVKSVAAILQSAPDLLNETNLGQTPLQAAVHGGRTNIVEYLDRQGVRWDPASAVLAGRTDVLRNLITQQPGLAADGSLLRLAAANGKIAAVETLLAAGADLKATDPSGLSPLGNALALHHNEVSDLLVKHGAVENIFDAVVAGHPETAAALISHDKSLVAATNPQGASLAEMAAATGNEPTLKLLLDKGISPDLKNARTGRSLLHAAAFYDQIDTAKLLIQRRAKVDNTDDLGFTPLHVSAIRGSMGVLELLLKHKADCNIRSAAPKPPRPLNERMPVGGALLRLEGSTPLHLAALYAQTNAIQCLLTWGASINAANSRGATALDLAAQLDPPAPAFLINNAGLGLPLATRNSRYYNPSVRQATAALLEQAGAKHGEPPRHGEFPQRSN